MTVLEILSPANKVPGEGRELYEHKRRRVLDSLTNLAEAGLCPLGPGDVSQVGAA